MKRVVIILIVVGLTSLIGWTLYNHVSESAINERRSRSTPSVAVEVEPVRQGTVANIGTFTGSLKAKSLFLVTPKVSGRLEKIMVNIGDKLSQNQLIASIDDAEFQQGLQQAAAYLDVAKANLEAAQDLLLASERELERIRLLEQKNLISASDLDSAKSAYTTQLSRLKVTRAQLNEKQAAYEVARIRLSYTRIKNIWSVDGSHLIVGERFVDQGALLNSNTPIISIIDISSMVGVIHVTERDYFKIALGQHADIQVDALKNSVFSGKIVRISPLVKAETRAAQVELEIDNPSGILKPGLFIRVSIQFSSHDNTTIVPVSALVKRNNTTGVFRVDQDKNEASFVQVTTGIVQGNVAEILSPPLDGVVVTLGHHLLEDGSTVTISKQEAPQASGSPEGKPGKGKK